MVNSQKFSVSDGIATCSLHCHLIFASVSRDEIASQLWRLSSGQITIDELEDEGDQENEIGGNHRRRRKGGRKRKRGKKGKEEGR